MFLIRKGSALLRGLWHCFQFFVGWTLFDWGAMIMWSIDLLNISWFPLLKCQDLLLYLSSLIVNEECFGFRLLVGQMNIWWHNFSPWETVFKIFHFTLYRRNDQLIAKIMNIIVGCSPTFCEKPMQTDLNKNSVWVMGAKARKSHFKCMSVE